MKKDLKTAFRINALSCLGFGILFIIMPNTIGTFLNGITPVIILWIGIGLSLHALHLILASLRQTVKRIELIYFILSDVLWVLASITLVTIIPYVINSASSIATTSVVAILVGSIGFLQVIWGKDILIKPQNS